ncbi:hypothetical protein M404DRAFT_927971 [Pisolithus tinctorius Marx 270]|uniref:Uncharacterized protein n=1 Tax=Pisolithus tinctorius Marx 270 TaxID=870435 RepID=A0A0C3JGG1_PISTI|nr:hypothetical protein M404DRAFT_927971 [Pisolithus tinctorius Marx 270]
MCDKSQRLCTLSFTDARPTANELATLLYVTSAQTSKYAIAQTQCYWFVATVFDALKMLYKGAVQDNPTHRGGTIRGVPVAIKASGKEVCAKYREARAALSEEIEQERRLKQEVTCLGFLFTVRAHDDPNSKRKKGSENASNARPQRKPRKGCG